MSQSLQQMIKAARQLPPIEQQRLAEAILSDLNQSKTMTAEQTTAVAVVEELFGAIKGLDRDTLIWLAEDEELCGY